VQGKEQTPALWMVGLVIGIWSLPCGASLDIDGDGYIGRVEATAFAECLGGPNVGNVTQQCLDSFDLDGDGDVDLVDHVAFNVELGHVPVPLKDRFGNPVMLASTEPYSPRQTCGNCHDHTADAVANGEWFQQGRADVAGDVDMADDYYGDGRFWIKSSGRYGKWGQSFQKMLAAKDNAHPSEIDQTTFAWVRDCSGCHSGGGPGEVDRDDQLIFNAATGQFGYELLGQTPGDVALDGDYSLLDYATGSVSLAPWEITGVSEPDCLLCHRDNRPTVDGVDMVQSWRRSTLAAGAGLVDSAGLPVPAFAAASTSGQGWFEETGTKNAIHRLSRASSMSGADGAWLDSSTAAAVKGTGGPILQIDYSVGVADGSLMVGGGNEVFLNPESTTLTPTDAACVSCHPLAVVTGTVWFDERDVMYSGINKLSDDDPNNDIPPEHSTACTYCHPAGLGHDAAKGNSFQLQYRDELDYTGFRSCRECHLTDLPGGGPNPEKDPAAPGFPGDAEIHHIDVMMGTLSCQACHIPYALTAGLLFRDITMPGSIGWTSQYLSADPLDPSDPDKTTWYPDLRWKQDSDGEMRLFPASVWVNIYFADWDQNSTPGDLSDDIISPIPTWRVAQVVGADPLQAVTDDDGDGRLEINRPPELLAYFDVLRGNDANGAQVAANPVMVRGHRVWYEEAGASGGVAAFEHEGTGIPMTSYPYVWGMDHNVLAADEAWGSAASAFAGCLHCHQESPNSPVFDRKILIDPDDPNEGAVYTTVRDRLGFDPPVSEEFDR